MAGPGPSDDEVLELIKIASRVPDHGKLAPWKFVRYTPGYCVELGKKILAREIALNGQCSREAADIERNRFTRVPVVIGVISTAAQHAKIPVWEQQLSAGAAAMTLLIAANALGYDAQWLTEWYAFDDELKPEFGAADNERIAGFIHIGTRTMPKTERSRPEVSDIFVTMGT